MYTQGLTIEMRVRESKYEIGTPSEKKKFPPFIFTYFFILAISGSQGTVS